MKIHWIACAGVAAALGLLAHGVLAQEKTIGRRRQGGALDDQGPARIPRQGGRHADGRIPAGAGAKPHRHNSHVFVYVLAGSYATQVAGGERVVLRPGETFYELPSDEHVVSANASNTEPAKILVFMLKDKDAPR
jgi:quercetin dioxygenase-like cupin family protein